MSMQTLLEAKRASWGLEDRFLLQDINLSLHRGEFFVIIGANGAGKTSLLKLLAGLILPAEGDVRAHLPSGRIVDMRDAVNRSLLRTAFVFQVGGLISNLSVFDNIALPLRYHDYLPEPRVRQLVDASLAEFGLTEMAAQRPGRLTPGLEKRVQIARAKVVDADILFYDDPELGLDAMQTGLVRDAIAHLHDGKKRLTVLTSSMPGWSLGLADRVALMDKGRVEALGTVKELLAHPSAQARTFLEAHRHGA